MNTSINNISITRHKKCSLFVIDITTLLFNLNFIEGKAPDISNVSKLIVADIRMNNNRTR